MAVQYGSLVWMSEAMQTGAVLGVYPSCSQALFGGVADCLELAEGH